MVTSRPLSEVLGVDHPTSVPEGSDFGTVEGELGVPDLDDDADELQSSVLDEASVVVDGRENDHGTAEETHTRIARMWEAYLDLPDGTIEAHDAAVMLGLLKDARIRENPTKRDSWVDRAGYVECGHRCVENSEGEQ